MSIFVDKEKEAIAAKLIAPVQNKKFNQPDSDQDSNEVEEGDLEVLDEKEERLLKKKSHIVNNQPCALTVTKREAAGIRARQRASKLVGFFFNKARRNQEQTWFFDLIVFMACHISFGVNFDWTKLTITGKNL